VGGQTRVDDVILAVTDAAAPAGASASAVSDWGRPDSCQHQPPDKQRANRPGVGSGVF